MPRDTPYETKDAPLTADDIKAVVDPLMTAFEEYKKTNDQRLDEIKKKGVADPLHDEKLAKLEKTIAGFEGINATLTAQAATIKAAQEEAAEAKERAEKLELRLNRPGTGGADGEAQRKKKHDTWLRASMKAISMGVFNLPEAERKALDEVAAEMKALSLNPDTAGGYLAPVEYVQEIIKAETEMSPVRSLVRVRPTTAKSIQIPKRTGQFAAQWVAEQGTRSETTGLAYGLEEIHAHEVYALVDISNQMLEDTVFDMEAELRMEAAEQFAVAEGAALVSGATPGKPAGFMVDANVETTNSGAATTITADGMITLKHAVKTAYTRNANFVMNRTTLGSVRKLKDGSGQYLWMPGLAMGKPNTIDGDPYVELPDMPSEGAGLKPIAYGDFRRAYILVDRIAMEVLRDPYTQATSGNVRFIMRRRIGGQVVLAEAIRTLTCAA